MLVDEVPDHYLPLLSIADQVLVEKLMRSCNGIRNIYVLLRSKKNLNAKQRLEELLNSKVNKYLYRSDRLTIAYKS